MKEKIILGIDPGTAILGYGLIKIVNKKPELIILGNIDLKKYTDHYVKLKKIYDRLIQLIDTYHPDHLSIEAPFYGKNVQSMLKLGRAQGVAMAAALARDIPITEYAPLKIKQSITGNGRASKEQVAKMLQRTLNIAKLPANLDATDGLAAAMCHFYQESNPISTNPSGSWKEFISKNPSRVK